LDTQLSAGLMDPPAIPFIGMWLGNWLTPVT